MIIGGLQRFSLLDYPGQISAIIFTQGCNFRCGFCYNPMLVWPIKVSEVKYIPAKGDDPISGNEKGQYSNEDDLFRFLEKRSGKLDAVVITGGEPTIHKDLPEFIKRIREIGYKIKLDTNGTNPNMLKKLTSLRPSQLHPSLINLTPTLLTSPQPSPYQGEGEKGRGGSKGERGKKGKRESLVDYVAMDIKSYENKYEKTAGVKIDFKNIEKSVKIIRESGLPYEFRTTVVRGLVDKKEVEEISSFLDSSDTWFLQKFKPETNLLDEKFKSIKPFTGKEMIELREIGRKRVKRCEVR